MTTFLVEMRVNQIQPFIVYTLKESLDFLDFKKCQVERYGEVGWTVDYDKATCLILKRENERMTFTLGSVPVWIAN